MTGRSVPAPLGIRRQNSVSDRPLARRIARGAGWLALALCAAAVAAWLARGWLYVTLMHYQPQTAATPKVAFSVNDVARSVEQTLEHVSATRRLDERELLEAVAQAVAAELYDPRFPLALWARGARSKVGTNCRGYSRVTARAINDLAQRWNLALRADVVYGRISGPTIDGGHFWVRVINERTGDVVYIDPLLYDLLRIVDVSACIAKP